LQIRVTSSDSQFASGGRGAGITLNGAAGYRRHTLRGTGSTPTSVNESAATRMNVYNIPYGGGGADGFGASIIDILDFASTVKNKTVRAISGYHDDGVGEIMFSSGLYNNTSAVTSVSLSVANSRSFAIKSRFSLYGVK
jgi:hypothetical protein